VYAVIMTISVDLLPFPYLASGLLAEWAGAGVVITGGGLLILLSGIAIRLFSPLAAMELESKQNKPNCSPF
jgi:hypothetical protein